MSDFKTPSKYDVFDVTKNTDDLKKLIAEHPDYPIVVLAGEQASAGDWYYWTFCSDIRFDVGEILTVQAPYNDELICTDRDEFEEEFEEWLWDAIDQDGSGRKPPSEEEFQQILKKELAKYDPYWKDVIMIHADN